MHHKKGFSLLSFLMYLMIFSIVTLFFCHIITVFIIPSFAVMRKNQSIVALHIASDFFVRDIRSMRNGTHAWKLISPQELIWEREGFAIGWRFYQNSLERREGIYKDHTWHKTIVSIIAKDIAHLIFTTEKNGDVLIGISLIMTSQYAHVKPITCYVSLKKEENSHEKRD